LNFGYLSGRRNLINITVKPFMIPLPEVVVYSD